MVEFFITFKGNPLQRKCNNLNNKKSALDFHTILPAFNIVDPFTMRYISRYGPSVSTPIVLTKLFLLPVIKLCFLSGKMGLSIW